MESPKGNKGVTLTLYFLLVTFKQQQGISGMVTNLVNSELIVPPPLTPLPRGILISPALISFFFYFLQMRYKVTRCYSVFIVVLVTVGSTLLVIVLTSHSLVLVSPYVKARFFQGGTILYQVFHNLCFVLLKKCGYMQYTKYHLCSTVTLNYQAMRILRIADHTNESNLFPCRLIAAPALFPV